MTGILGLMMCGVMLFTAVALSIIRKVSYNYKMNIKLELNDEK